MGLLDSGMVWQGRGGGGGVMDAYIRPFRRRMGELPEIQWRPV